MYKVSRLDSLSAPAYAAFSYPAYRHLLGCVDPGTTVAIGVTNERETIGLGLGRVSAQRTGEILSIYVADEHRGFGVGTTLLSSLEDEFLKLDCTRLFLTYAAGKPSTPALERILLKRNWAPSESRMLLCRLHTGIAEEHWIQKSRLPEQYSILPWAEVTRSQVAAIRERQERELWAPENLLPFEHERDAEPINSLALACHGEIVGWVLTHRIAPDTIRYTVLFVRRDIQRIGLGASLLAEAIRRQVSALGANSFGSFGVPLENTRMIAFVNKRLAAYLVSRIETRGTHKLLAMHR